MLHVLLQLYPDQMLNGASCGHGLECLALGVAGVSSKLTLPHQDTLWQPNRVIRTSNWHKVLLRHDAAADYRCCMMLLLTTAAA